MISGRLSRGTTLVELVLALAFSALVMSGLIAVYWSGSRIFAEQAAYTDAQYSVRSSVQQMGQDIRSASALEILDNGAQLRLTTVTGELVRYYLYDQQLFWEGISNRGTVRLPIAENINHLHFSVMTSLVTININAIVAGKTYQLTTGVNSRLVY